MGRQLALDLDGLGIEAKDVFEAAHWLAGECNSSARASAADMVEWKCQTFGSGLGAAYWSEVATFGLVAVMFGLRTTSDRDGCDELVVEVPLELFPQVSSLLKRLNSDPEEWPWRSAPDKQRALQMAGDVLGMPLRELKKDRGLQKALHLV